MGVSCDIDPASRCNRLLSIALVIGQRSNFILSHHGDLTGLLMLDGYVRFPKQTFRIFENSVAG